MIVHASLSKKFNTLQTHLPWWSCGRSWGFKSQQRWGNVLIFKIGNKFQSVIVENVCDKNPNQHHGTMNHKCEFSYLRFWPSTLLSSHLSLAEFPFSRQANQCTSKCSFCRNNHTETTFECTLVCLSVCLPAKWQFRQTQ